jgi:flagellar M-ring protein FliF
VQVAADINYNHTQTTEEKFDPDSKVVRSTQTVEQNASNTSGSTNNAVSVANALPGAANPANTNPTDQSKDTSGRTEETTNYEISKIVKTSTVDGGDIKKVSVAVVVDGSGDTAASYKPRTAEEMSKITALVKSAMGFDSARGDLVQVTNMQFARIEDASGTPAPKPLLGLDSSYWFKIIEAGIMCVTALLIGLFVARPLINRMFAAQVAAGGGGTVALANPSPVAGSLSAPAAAGTAPSPGEGGAAALPAPNASIDISRIDGQVRESSIKKVGEVVTAHPEEALAIIRTWLHQPV